MAKHQARLVSNTGGIPVRSFACLDRHATCSIQEAGDSPHRTNIQPELGDIGSLYTLEDNLLIKRTV
jgi:hypothetical protein